MNYKLVLEFPSLIIGGFIECIFAIMAFFIFWQVVLVGQSFGSWQLHEILVFSCFGYLGWGIASFFFTGVWEIPFKIIEGEIERWLCRPVKHPLLGVLSENVWVGGGAYVITGILLIGIVVPVYGIKIFLLNSIIALLVMIFGMTALYLLYGTITSFAGFTIGRIGFLEEAIFSMEENFQKIPVTTLPLGLRTFLLVGFPVGMMSALPSEIFLGRIPIINSLGILLVSGILAFIWAFLFIFVWNRGIKRYESASN